MKIITRDQSILLSPQVDFVFRVLFGSENQKELLSSLVSSLVGESVPEITLMNPFLMRNYPLEKEGVLDIKLKTSEGRQFFIEMQAERCREIQKRILFYWAKLHGSQPIKGRDYDSLRRTTGICIIGGAWFKGDYQVSRYQALEKDQHTGLCENFDLLFLDLRNPNIPPGYTYSTDLCAWIRFLSARTEEEMIMAAEASEPVARAYKTLKTMSQDEDLRELSEAREQWLFDQACRERAAREEGREVGREEGREEGRLEGETKAVHEMIHHMKESGFEIDIISRITSLSPDKIRIILSQ